MTLCLVYRNEELGGKPFTSRTIRFTVSDGDFSGYNTVM